MKMRPGKRSKENMKRTLRKMGGQRFRTFLYIRLLYKGMFGTSTQNCQKFG